MLAGRKLFLSLPGAAAVGLLDMYYEERKPHVAAIIHQAVALGRVVCISDPTEAAIRDMRSWLPRGLMGC